MDLNLYHNQAAKYLAGQMDVAEKEAFLAWVNESPENRQFFEKLEKTWKLTGTVPAPAFSEDIAPAWDNIFLAIQQPSPAKTVRLYRRWAAVAAAAVVALALVAGWWWYAGPDGGGEMVQVFSAESDTTHVLLPDGSAVWLNAHSRLAYRSNFRERIVELEGEAFFDIAHQQGNPFRVMAGGSETTVLGTAFNVRAYPGEKQVEIAVDRGKVAFADSRQADKPILLEAGQAAALNLDNNALQALPEKEANANAWHTRELMFEDVPLARVKTAIERYFNITLIAPDETLWNCRFQGHFQNPELDQILQVIAFTLSLQIEQQENQILLIGSGCESQ